MNKLEEYSTNILLAFPLFIGIGLSKMIKDVGSDTWICIILGTFIGLIFNKIRSMLPNKECKYIRLTYIISIMLLSIMNIAKLVSSIYLNKTPIYIIIIPILLVLYYVSKKDNNTVNKVSFILFIIYILLALIPILTLTPTIDIDVFIPVYTHNIKDIILSSIDYALISTTPFIVLDNYKYSPKTYIVSSIILLIRFTIIIGNLGIELCSIYRYPEYMIFKRISLLNFIENIENILFFMWIINSFILTSNSIINIKKRTNNIFIIILLVLIFILCSIHILDNYLSTYLIFKYYTYILLGLNILYIIDRLLGKKKR